MKCNHIVFKVLICVFILISGLPSSSLIIASNLQDQSQLKANRKQAQELMNTNKNAPALEVLERTGKLQDNIFKVQRDSVAAALQADFLKNQKVRQAEISKKEITIAELKAGNEDIDRENFKMIRSTLLFFGILVGVAVLILLNRFRKLSGLKTQLIASEAHLAAAEKIIATGYQYDESINKLRADWSDVVKNMTDASSLLLKISNDKQHPLQKQVIKLQQSTASVNSILNEEEPNSEPAIKQPVDLNQMIEEVVNQAYHYTCAEHPEFKCTVTKDLEKILPKVDLVTADIRFVLFNLLSNAFDAVREKRTNAPKGYDPRVTVSTRKLPRFIQIRVRDNGMGILAKDPDQVFEAFYTSKNAAKHSGLGLAESKRIITTIYKGELFIESDFTTGTDFIIRFPILTLM